MAIIKNYGMFWERSRIDWGRQGKSGHLCGYQRWVHNKPEGLRNFRDQAGIYILYEGANIASQRVIYVGETGTGVQRLFHRLRQHTRDDLWNRWQRFSWFGIFDVGGTEGAGVKHAKPSKTLTPSVKDALVQLEGMLITLFEAPKNKQGPRWGGVRQYFQYQEEVETSGALLDDGDQED